MRERKRERKKEREVERTERGRERVREEFKEFKVLKFFFVSFTETCHKLNGLSSSCCLICF